MELIPIHTPVVRSGDDLASLLAAHADLRDGDILVCSSKVMAMAEGAAITLDHLQIGEDARIWSEKTGRSAPFMQAVANETKRLNGSIVGFVKGAVLTELQPAGLRSGTLLVPNAGLDESNIEKEHAIGWPHDPVQSARRLQSDLKQEHSAIGIIISDSCVSVRRRGVVAFALSACGINPLRSEIGKPDLFGQPLKITVEATADQLATAANLLMGNAAQSIPAVIIRNHAIPFSDYCGWVEGIEPEEDLFAAILQRFSAL